MFAYELVSISTCGYGHYVREGVKEYDIHCWPKFYKLKLLGNLVVLH